MAEGEGAAVSKSGSPDPLLGRSINERFKITALIARGGMGKVYRAEQSPLGRVCAVKVLNPNYSGEQDPEFHKRFFMEASIASKLTHPNTVTIFDYGRTEDDVYYMAMEYLEGKTLHRAIREAGSFPEDRVAHVARQICRAVREAHGLGVIHRDLKPANIFLVSHGDETDFVKVLDFGLVKNVSEKNEAEDLTQTGLFMGSPKYMAPEQIRGDRVDARTDVYSMGIILYEMITGKVPFDKSNSVNILMAHVSEPPRPLRTANPSIVVSAHMEEVVTRCIAKDPDRRYKSMDELLAQLKVMSSAHSGTYAFDSVMPPPVTTVPPLPEEVSQRISEPPQATGASGVVSTLGASSAANAPWPSLGPVPVPEQEASWSRPRNVPTDLDLPPVRSGKARVIFALLALFGAGAGAFVFVSQQPQMQGSSPKPTATVVAAVVTAKPAPEPATVLSAPLPALVLKVRVTTEPDGATVKEDGVEICASTPCDVTYRGPSADATKEHKLVLAKSGYKPETKTIKVGDTPISVKLAKSAGPSTWPPAPPRPVDPIRAPARTSRGRC